MHLADFRPAGCHNCLTFRGATIPHRNLILVGLLLVAGALGAKTLLKR